MPDLPTITDHCLLRYFERVLGYDTEAVRRAIGKKCATAIAAGASTKIDGDLRYEFKNGVVVTITKVAPGHPCRARRETLIRGKA
jgi:hypothetical protein